MSPSPERVVSEATDKQIKELEEALAQLRQDSEVAYVLLGFSGALAEVRPIEETLGLAVRTVPELFGAERCFAARWEDEDERFEILAESGYMPAEIQEIHRQTQLGRDAFPTLLSALQERQSVFTSGDPDPDRSVITIPLVRWGRDFGGLRLEFGHAKKFGQKDEALARGVARLLGVALDNARRFNLLQRLRGFGTRVGSLLRLNEVIQQVTDGAVELFSADGAWIYFLDSESRSLVSAGGASQALALPEKLARLPLNEEPWAGLVRGENVVTDTVGPHFGKGTVGGTAVALTGANRKIFGALLVVHDEMHKPGPEELEALNVLAGQASQAIENARRFDRERSVARSMQEGLLRVVLPPMPGCDLGAVYEPADGEADVGGDLYDVIDLADGTFGVVVGDVSGKGATAAAQTAMVKYMLRAFALQESTPESVMFQLNNALVRELPEDRFITLMYAVFDPKERTCCVAIAGHPPPLIYRAASGEVEEIKVGGGIMGIFEDVKFEEVSAEISVDDVFVAYTDGLVEARAGEELYEVDRVKQSLAAHSKTGSAKQIARRVYEDARRFGRITDDTVILALTCRHKP